MFFNGTKIKEIGEEIPDEKLQNFLNKNEIGFRVTDSESNRWTAYAIYIGMNHLHLTQVESCSFGYMISTFFSWMGLSCGTDAFFREEEIEYNILDEYNKLNSMKITNCERKKKLFQYICDLYAHHIDKYTYKTETLSFRVSLGTKQRFENVEGESFNDKLVNLLRDRKI